MAVLENDCRNKRTVQAHSIPQQTKRTLSAERRIHKICKGPRLSRRNEDAKEHLEAAKEWLRSNGGALDARSSAKARLNAAATLSRALSISRDTARGLVTSLKKRGVL